MLAFPTASPGGGVVWPENVEVAPGGRRGGESEGEEAGGHLSFFAISHARLTNSLKS